MILPFLKKLSIDQLTFNISLGLGGLFGAFFSSYCENFISFNDIISNLLTMCLIPIIMTTIIKGIVSLYDSRKIVNLKIFLRTTVYLIIGISFLSCLVPSIFKIGLTIDFSQSEWVEELTSQASLVIRDIKDPIENLSREDFFQFLKNSIPSNLFTALTDNKLFQIIMFSIIFAVAMAYTPKTKSLQNYINTIYEIFEKIFETVMVFIPIIIFTSTAILVSQVGIKAFYSLTYYLLYFLILLSIIFVGNFVLICYGLKQPPLFILKQLKNPLIISATTSTLIAMIPVHNFFKTITHRSSHLLQIIVPITLFIGRYGNLMYFIFSSICISQIYGHNLGIAEYVLISVFSILASISSAGMINSSAVIFLTVVLDPLGIPVGPMIILLGAIDFIIYPVINMVNVLTSITALSLNIKTLSDNNTFRIVQNKVT